MRMIETSPPHSPVFRTWVRETPDRTAEGIWGQDPNLENHKNIS